ncbi:MAG TPA: hypothetical protein VI172_01700 [Candidatus Dormibacteraeota bacterium]|jgi:hypothetical protein
MRLRQAHAILEAATALEACGLGFELSPLQYDYPGAPRRATQDAMSGYTEFTDPDKNDRDARVYNIDLRPGPDDDHIEAHLTYGLGPDPESLLYSKWSVAIDVGDAERFRGLVGAQLAEKIADIVREHEKPYRDAYEKRARNA